MKAATDENGNEIEKEVISIHAAREGGDDPDAVGTVAKPFISIHAAREGGDALPEGTATGQADFNPRRP